MYPIHVRDIYFLQSLWFNLKSRALTRKINICLYVNIYFSVWESTFIHTLCISLYKILQPNVNLTECGRINGTLCFILKILFNEYVYLYASILSYILIQRYICICNAFPVSKHHLLILTLHSDFDFSQTNMVDWSIFWF